MTNTSKDNDVLSAEYLLSAPIKVGSKQTFTRVVLFNTSTSKSLMDQILINENEMRVSLDINTIWRIQTGNLSKDKKDKVENIWIPLF